MRISVPFIFSQTTSVLVKIHLWIHCKIFITSTERQHAICCCHVKGESLHTRGCVLLIYARKINPNMNVFKIHAEVKCNRGKDVIDNEMHFFPLKVWQILQ